MRWFEGVWWRKRHPAGEHGGAFCGGGFGGRGGASRRLRAAVEEGILGLRGFRALRLKPIRIWIFDGIGNRLIPAGDFFLEKKQKRARCSGLPSRFILCRTCRAKAACLGGVSVCIPYAAGAACSSSTVRHARTRLWPCACAQGGGSKGSASKRQNPRNFEQPANPLIRNPRTRP